MTVVMLKLMGFYFPDLQSPCSFAQVCWQLIEGEEFFVI